MRFGKVNGTEWQKKNVYITGVRCPCCGSPAIKTNGSREIKRDNIVYRRKNAKCKDCEHTFFIWIE